MTEPIPNVPLARCRKLVRAATEVAETASNSDTFSGDDVEALLLEIANELEQLALEIQQDQSGEI